MPHAPSHPAAPAAHTARPARCRLVRRAVTTGSTTVRREALGAALWACALARTPVASAARAGADAVFPSQRDPAADPSGLLRGVDGAPSPKDFSRLSVHTRVLSPESPRGAAATPLDGASRTAALALSRRAADAADHVAHVRAHLRELLAALSSSSSSSSSSGGGAGGDGGSLSGAELVGALAPILQVAPAPQSAPAAGGDDVSLQPAPTALLLTRVRPVAGGGGSGGGGTDAATLRQLATSSSSRYSIDAVVAAVLAGLRASPAFAPPTPPPPPGGGASPAAAAGPTALGAAIVRARGLRRATVAHSGGTLPPAHPAHDGLDDRDSLPCVVVEDCADSTVLLSVASQSAAVVGCVRSCVVLGPAAGHVVLDGCDGCTVHAAGGSVTLHNCTDCVVHVRAAGSAPLLAGDCRGVRLAPYGARYAGLRAQAAATRVLPPGAGVERDGAFWDAPLDATLLGGAGGLAAGGASRGGSGEVWSLLPPADFAFRAALPAGACGGGDSGGSGSAGGGSAPGPPLPLALRAAPPASDAGVDSASFESLPLPRAYESELAARLAAAARLRREVQDAVRALGGGGGGSGGGGSGSGGGVGGVAAQRLQLAVQAAFKVCARARGCGGERVCGVLRRA